MVKLLLRTGIVRVLSGFFPCGDFQAFQDSILRMSGLSTMESLRPKLVSFLLLCVLLFQFRELSAQPITVRHLEGETFSFLVLRNVQGQAIAYGEFKQVVNTRNGLVTHNLHFRFKDGSSYQEITKFTQKREFRLVSNQVVQKGPSFKKESESWIDAATGKITVRTVAKGKEELTTKHLDLPSDISNGLLSTLVKNVDPSAPETIVSMVATSSKPRLVELHIVPVQEKTIKVGLITQRVQRFEIKMKVKGVAGLVAPLVDNQAPDVHIWIVKSEAPTVIELEGPLSQDSPVWRIQVTAPETDSPKNVATR